MGIKYIFKQKDPREKNIKGYDRLFSPRSNYFI